MGEQAMFCISGRASATLPGMGDVKMIGRRCQLTTVDDGVIQRADP